MIKTPDYIIGIDGGMHGAMTVLGDDGIVEKTIMLLQPAGKGRNEYDCLKIVDFLSKYPEATVILEKAYATPIMGNTSLFSFGKSYGIMIGILSALRMKYIIVAAKTWQKEMFKDVNRKNTKQASAIVAQRLFPKEDFKATLRCRKIHDGLTDSALIAEYGRRYL